MILYGDGLGRELDSCVNRWGGSGDDTKLRPLGLLELQTLQEQPSGVGNSFGGSCSWGLSGISKFTEVQYYFTGDCHFG